MPPKAKPIPDGYHSLTPGLSIRDAARAIEFYQKALGAKVRMRMDRPDGKVMHAELQIGDSVLMLGEEDPERGQPSPQSLKGTAVSFYLYVEDVDKAFDRAVKAGAKVEMPLTDMFWGDRIGVVVDPFGHRWTIATHKEDVGPEEMGKRAKEFFKKMGMG